MAVTGEIMESAGPDVNAEKTLAEARAEIDRIDAGILELLAKRLEIVDRVGRVKRESGIPVYHPAREENLITGRRADAERLGLDPALVEDLFRAILRGSRITQSETMKGRSVKPGAAVVIVGGRGQMGRSLAEWFTAAAYDVRILDREDWDNAVELCRGAALALLSVPIEATAAVADKVARLLEPGCVLADITSVKRGPLEAMLAAHPGPVLGLHPMFGPGTRSLDKQIVVVTAGRDEAASRWVVDQLASWGAVVVNSTAEEHDRVMDVVQALRHFATFAFGQFLCSTGVDLARTLEFSSPIYRLELGMVGRLFAQDPDLYSKIIFSTPERRQLLLRYVQSMVGNVGMLENGDEEAFLNEFNRIAKWFGPFSDQAIRESGYLIDKMIERF